MKLIGVALCAFVVVCATSFPARASQTETKSKVTVVDGRTVRVTGCVAQTGSTGYMLTNVADKSRALSNYLLVSDDADLSKHIGHRVQLSGKVTDRGDAKLRIETKTKTKVEDGDDRKTSSTSEVQGDILGLPYLGVKSVKMLAAVCR